MQIDHCNKSIIVTNRLLLQIDFLFFPFTFIFSYVFSFMHFFLCITFFFYQNWNLRAAARKFQFCERSQYYILSYLTTRFKNRLYTFVFNYIFARIDVYVYFYILLFFYIYLFIFYLIHLIFHHGYVPSLDVDDSGENLHLIVSSFRS